ncbi:Calx-beta domain-containing protein [Actinoplanes sp. NPDC023714]|uniref:Calx-beta domain-containing protein n=1 Tax=Actinoplanes sp. NPDC023714 TaxID=3154322 RepID=UPI0033C4288C
MRYPQAHAAKSGSIPFALRGPKSMRRALSIAVAAAVGLVPTVMITSPAHAAAGDVTISSPTITEGGDLVFTLTREGAGSGQTIPTATYTLRTEAGSGNAATAGTDFVTSPSPTSVSFPDSETNVTRTVTVRTIDDALYEGATPETVKLVATSGGTTVEGSGSISDNDDAPGYTLTTTGPVTEGSGAKATLTARLDAPSGLETVVTLTAVDGTATKGNDYTDFGSGQNTITIAKGKTSATKDIVVGKDDVRDSAELENFTVTGTATNVAAPANTSVQVGITDIDPLPKVSIADSLTATVSEGAGTKTIPLELDLGSDKPVTVRWDAIPPTAKNEDHELATQGTDFGYPASTSRTVTFPARDTAEDATITITDDSLNEADEDFGVQLANPSNAELGTPSKADITITDNDSSQPDVTIDTTTVQEGNSGRASRTITAKLSAASGRTVKVKWATEAEAPAIGKATAVKDFVSKSGTLTFPAGTTTQTFSVDVVGDTVYEPGGGTGETFNIVLSDPVGAANPTPTNAVTITDDDSKPTFVFDDIAMPEGNETSAVLLPVKLSNGSESPVTFELTDPGSGTAVTTNSGVGGNDYAAGSAEVTIPAESTTGYGVMLINGDLVNERDETVNLTLTPKSGDSYLSSTRVTGTSDSLVLTLENDDKAPELKINDVTGEEGGTVAVTGTVSGVSDQAMTATIAFAGASGNGVKAADAADFINPGTQTVSIDPGTEPGSVVAITDVQIADDEVNEPNETIRVSGTSLGGFGSVTEGWITIAASDGGAPETPGAPTISTPAASIKGAGNATITGKATAGATVDLWGAPFGAEGPAVKLKSVTANSTGAYTFTHAITQGFIFQVAVGDMKSKELAVRVMQTPVLTATSPSRGNFTVTVTGNPKGAGQDILVQSWVSGAWKTVYKGKTGTNGVYSINKKLTSGKSLTFRAFVAGNTGVGVLGGWSVSKKVTVK